MRGLRHEFFPNTHTVSMRSCSCSQDLLHNCAEDVESQGLLTLWDCLLDQVVDIDCGHIDAETLQGREQLGES